MKNCMFLVMLLFSSNLLPAQNIVAAEYFLDAEAGVGRNTLITLPNPQPDGSYNLNINLTGASIGYHKLYIRTRDSDGHWSITTRKNIEVISSNFVKTVVRGEYFFDADPGYGLALPVLVTTPGETVLQNFTAAVGALPIGYHKLYTRVRDIDGNWSLTARRNVEVINTAIYVIDGVEYFFNTDPGIGNAAKFTFPTPLPDGSFSFKIPVGSIPPGSHTLYLRVRDSVYKRWSFTQSETDSVVTSVQSGLWSQPATWSNNKVPDANTIVLLYHNVEVDIVTAVCRSLTPFGNNVRCTVAAGQALRITGR